MKQSAWINARRHTQFQIAAESDGYAVLEADGRTPRGILENHDEIRVGPHLHIGFDRDRRAGSVVNVAYDEFVLILDGGR